MSKITRSWRLFKTALIVLRANKKLLLFPLVTMCFLIVIVLFFIVPVAFFPTGHSITDPEHWKTLVNSIGSLEQAPDAVNGGQKPVLHPNAAGYAIFAAIYLVSMFLSTFFNTAFYHEILKALRGESVSIRAGLAFSFRRIKAIALWSLLAGLVGVIIKFLEERVGLVGKLILKLVGIAWSVASVFAIPVIVTETEVNNPFEFLKSSARLLRRTWGESLIGFLGLQVSGLIIMLISLAWLIGAGILSGLLESPWPIACAFLIWLPSIIAFSYVASVAGQVYRGALYIYASTGQAPGPFDQDQMELAWKMKKVKLPRA